MKDEDATPGSGGDAQKFAAGRTAHPVETAAPVAGLPQVAPPAVVAPPEPPPVKPRNSKQTALKAVFAVVLIAVVGSLVWLALWLSDFGQNNGSSDSAAQGVMEISPTAPATPLPLPREGVPPSDFQLGDCFSDFDPESLQSKVVACDTGHSAQLVAIYRYPAGDTYPGAEALKAKALEACQAAKLAPAADDFTLNFQRAYPSSTSWESGDRRADCYVVAPGGNAITASVLP